MGYTFQALGADVMFFTPGLAKAVCRTGFMKGARELPNCAVPENAAACPTGTAYSPASKSFTAYCASAPSATKTCYPQPILSMIRVPGSSGGIQAQPRQVPTSQPCPSGYTTVAPCPSGTARSKTPGGGCEPISCPTGYTRDSTGQCQPPSPVNGNCPSPFQLMSSRCSAPDGTSLTYATRCGTPVMEAPRGPGWKPPPLPTCTPAQLTQANYTGPTAVTETACQTGYVFQPAQGADPAKCVPASQPTPPLVVVPPGPQSPVEAKASVAGGMDWVRANWKWLAALAAVGGGTYWWAKNRKADAQA